MRIKTKVTEIECSSDELRESRSLSDALCNIFRNCFNSISVDDIDAKDEEEGQDGEV